MATQSVAGAARTHGPWRRLVQVPAMWVSARQPLLDALAQGLQAGQYFFGGRGVVGEVVGAFLEGLHLDRYQRIEGAACMGQAEPGAFPFAGVGVRVEAPAFEGGQALADVEAVEQRAFFHFCRS